MRDVLRFLIVGVVAGWIAGLLVRGSLRTKGCLTNLVVGILGALIGGFLFKQLGIDGVASVVTATIGAVVLLVLVRALRV